MSRERRTYALTPDPTLGTQVLGRYRLIRYLAKGGMGAIYLGRAEGAAGFARPVVIKRALRAGDTQAERMFAREARILSRLHHPCILNIIDFAEEDGDYVMVLDYVHGYTLSEWSRYLRRRDLPMPVPHAVHAMVCVLEALDYAHQLTDEQGTPLGIVHRDVKPSNVLLDVQGHVKLADFGIARADTDVTETAITDVTLKGTLPYMAPELFARATPSRITDVYSAAVTLYSVLAGHNPFSENDAAHTVGLVVNHEADRLNMLRNDVSPALAQAIAIGLKKRPDERHASAHAFAQALRAAFPGRLEDAETEFRAAVRADFEASDFAEVVGVDSLRSRADALSRSMGDADVSAIESAAAPLPAPHLAAEVPTSMISTDVRSPAAYSAAADDADESSATRSLRPRDRALVPPATSPPAVVAPPVVTRIVAAPPRRSWPWFLIGGAVVGLAAGLSAWMARRERPPAPSVVMVRGDVSLEGADAAVATPVPVKVPVPVTPALADAAPPEASPKPRPTPPRDVDLAQVVRRQEGAITACFEKHAADVSGAPEMAYRFHVDTRGRVTQAELVPDSLSPTRLGRCLLGIARDTEFGPQRQAITFRIPITVRRK